VIATEETTVYDVNGRQSETTDNGYLASLDDWDKAVAEAIAAAEGLTLTQDHWDVIEYLRDAYLNNNGEQPNNRAILKAMQTRWVERKVDNKTLFDLYPGNPSKQAGKVAGLPESLRKGGY
jgi:tRNA 2-thiouridine synthesizing protein E